MIKITDLDIAKESFEYVHNIKNKLCYNEYVDFIDKHLDYFTWEEDTEEGKFTLTNIDKIPESFREGVLLSHSKQKANAEFNDKKEYYEVSVNFNRDIGIITINFDKRALKHHLKIFIEMANYLDALLLVDGTKVINEETLKSELS